MPIYEYVCDDLSCRQKEERIHSSNVTEAYQCPACEGRMHREFPVPGRIRMGTGTTRRDSGMNRTEV